MKLLPAFLGLQEPMAAALRHLALQVREVLAPGVLARPGLQCFIHHQAILAHTRALLNKFCGTISCVPVACGVQRPAVDVRTLRI
jgi:hypothetical protein